MVFPVGVKGFPVGIDAGVYVVQVDAVESLLKDSVDGGGIIAGGLVLILAAAVDDELDNASPSPLTSVAANVAPFAIMFV